MVKAIPSRKILGLRNTAMGGEELRPGLQLAGLLAAILAGLLTGTALGAPEALTLRQEAEISQPFTVTAVAVNADESLLAAASAEGGQITLTDRRSHAPLGVVETSLTGVTALAFAPLGDRLVAAGEGGLELWDIPLSRLSAGKPLDPSHRLWKQPAVGKGALGFPGFALHPDRVYWAQGGQVFTRAVHAQSPPASGPVWSGEGAPVKGMTLDPDNNRLALYLEGEKEIQWLSLANHRRMAGLTGHRFPLVGLALAGRGRLLSLDQGKNLITWQLGGRTESMVFLDKLPDTAEQAGLMVLAEPYLLLPGAAAGKALALDTRTRKTASPWDLPVPPALAASSTGKYLLAGSGKKLRLYRFSQPGSPLEYIRRLKGAGATAVAESFFHQLDPEGISPSLMEDMREEIEAKARPRFPSFLAPEKHSADGAQVLALARQAFEEGRYRAALDLLTGSVDPADPAYPEVVELIRRAEEKRNMDLTLAQAEEKTELGLYHAARTMADEVLRKDEHNSRALALKARIDEKEGGDTQQLAALVLGFLLALGIMAVLMIRFRFLAQPLMDLLALKERWRAHRFTRPRQTGPTPAKAPPRPGKPGPAKPRGADDPGARARVNQLLLQAEGKIRSLREADSQRQHAALFLELEAELSTCHRRLSGATSGLGSMAARLEEILAQLARLKIQAGKAEPPPAQGEPSYYELLGVAFGASDEAVKSAYYKRIKEYHPDMHSHARFNWIKEEAEKMSRKLGEAYEVLKDKQRRARYDERLAKQGRKNR
ncbi:MAG: DnaJ domain-containing protein [Deltaproteobacteria bacterium]|nr:DnaJ domain-containing protein [Deltaproteobacteria bacterium]